MKQKAFRFALKESPALFILDILSLSNSFKFEQVGRSVNNLQRLSDLPYSPSENPLIYRSFSSSYFIY